jgi:hypothetical protein
MSAIGDRLRQAAEEADSNESFVSFAVIVTENSSFRFFLSHIQDEDEARVMCAIGLVNTLGLRDNRKEQIDAADVWIKSTLGAPD